MEKTVGFIILRHINSIQNSLHYLISYNNIRKYYPENHIKYQIVAKKNLVEVSLKRKLNKLFIKIKMRNISL